MSGRMPVRSLRLICRSSFCRCLHINGGALGNVATVKDAGKYVAEKWKTMIFDEKSATGFENTTTLGLLRAAVVLRLSSSEYISNNAIMVCFYVDARLY